jgi:hypothetical protein
MIRGVTLTTTMGFVNAHEGQVRQLVRGFVDAIHFFITRKQETLEVLKEHASTILDLQSDQEVEMLYEEWAHSLEHEPYPSIEAIANVFQLAVRRNPELASSDYSCTEEKTRQSVQTRSKLRRARAQDCKATVIGLALGRYPPSLRDGATPLKFAGRPQGTGPLPATGEDCSSGADVMNDPG